MTAPEERSGARAALVFVLAASLLTAACGRKGPPLPPRAVVPAAVRDLRAEPRGLGVRLSWTRPSRNDDGSPLTDLREFRVLRATLPLGQAAAPASAFSFLTAVRAEDPENATVHGTLYVYRDDAGGQGLNPGRQYRYRIRAINRRGEAGVPSVEVFVDFTLVPPAPSGLTALPGDGAVNLEWHAPDDAQLVKGYNVYRGTQPGDYGPQPINPQPITTTTFRDTGLENDTHYHYVVRSVSNDRPPWRESVDSTAAVVVPQDFTPPAPPRGLTAVPGQSSIALTWDAGDARDLLGYFVYRRQLPDVAPTRLTPTPIPGTTYTDRDVRPGVTYVYTATAVDRSPHRNESAPSSEVEARLP